MGTGPSSVLVDFSKVDELKKKIQELREGALRKIDESSRKYSKGEGPCVNEKELKLFLHQIKNKMLLVAVVGEGSCGKSTLINAFLKDRILPSGVGTITRVRVFIGHDPNVHKNPCESSDGHCDKCPYLVGGIGKHDALCYGVRDIKSKITEENRQLAENNQEQKDPLVLYTYIPVFDSLSSSSNNCVPYLVDSPGVAKINDDVQSYYSILSAMIYVGNYLKLLQNEETARELNFKPKDASLFFVVNQFDIYYKTCADEPNPNEEETKTKVESDMKLVKREEVFPVCGLWALYARLALRYNPTDQISRVVEEAYNWIPKQKFVDELSNKAAIVSNKSGINKLEEKLKCSIDATNFQVWNNIMYKQCIKLLEGPIQAVGTILPIIESEIVDNSRNIERIQKNIDILEKMEEEVQEYVLERLENIQQLASNFFMKIMSPKIEEEIQILRRNGIESVNRNYTLGQYLEDLNTLMNNLSNLITQELNDKTKRCSEDLGSKLYKKYERLIRHIQGDSHNLTLTAEVQTQNIASFFFSEPSKNITAFVNSRVRNRRILNSALAAASAGTSVIATSAAGFLGFAAAITLAVAPIILASGAVITGLGGAIGTVHFIRQVLNTTDRSMELSDEEVKTLCDQMKSEITLNSAGRIKQKFEQAVADALRDYNRLLKAEYDREWGPKLNQRLQEAQISLRLMRDEKTELTQVRDELKKYSDSLKVLVQENE